MVWTMSVYTDLHQYLRAGRNPYYRRVDPTTKIERIAYRSPEFMRLDEYINRLRVPDEYRARSDFYAVRHHDTRIVIVSDHGLLILHNNGHFTRSTQHRMRKYSGLDITGPCRMRGMHRYHDGGPWRVNITDSLSVPMRDGQYFCLENDPFPLLEGR